MSNDPSSGKYLVEGIARCVPKSMMCCYYSVGCCHFDTPRYGDPFCSWFRHCLPLLSQIEFHGVLCAHKLSSPSSAGNFGVSNSWSRRILGCHYALCERAQVVDKDKFRCCFGEVCGIATRVHLESPPVPTARADWRTYQYHSKPVPTGISTGSVYNVKKAN
jgi:hypothetical protein